MDISKNQRHTRSGAGRGVSQANEAAIYPKLTGSCQHEIVSGILKNWKYWGTVQASYGCLVGHVFMGVRISVFAPQLCNTSVLGLIDYADGCLFEKGAVGTLFVWVGALEGRFGGGGPSGVSTPKSIRAIQNKQPPDHSIKLLLSATQ